VVPDPDPRIQHVSGPPVSRFRHYFLWIRILPSTSKKIKKNWIFTFVTSFLLFIYENTDVKMPLKSDKQNNFGKKN
jgi:hypothetical protein